MVWPQEPLMITCSATHHQPGVLEDASLLLGVYRPAADRAAWTRRVAGQPQGHGTVVADLEAPHVAVLGEREQLDLEETEQAVHEHASRRAVTAMPMTNTPAAHQP